MEGLIIFFYLIALIFSVILHEISHGYVALAFGDTTAKDAGRLTLNPFKHLDPIGSFLLPLMMVIVHGPVFGWAKPVPYDPRRLPNPKKQAGLIALAGPLTNFLIAVLFAIFFRILLRFPETAFLMNLALLLNVVIEVNLALAFFNLIPIPPLDGGGILISLLPRGSYQVQRFLQQYGFILLLVLIFMGLDFLGPLILKAHGFLIGFDLTSL